MSGTRYDGLMPSSPLSLPLMLLHWVLFLEAIYCFGVVGPAYVLGEGFSAALDILSLVLSFKEGVQATGLFYVYPVFVIGCSTLKRRLILFPWGQ